MDYISEFGITESDLKRFWGKIQKKESGCWELKTLRTQKKENSQFYAKGKVYTAASFAFVIANGRKPKKILRVCENPKCINPDHLLDALSTPRTLLDSLSDRFISSFWSRVDKTESCWLWKGHRDPNGYGQVRLNNVVYGCHRVAFAISNGTEPQNHVCHKCDNPSCVKPEHLFEGTAKDNIADMLAKKRGLIGSKNGQSKLKEQQVLEIRNLELANKYSHQQIAEMFGVSRRVVDRIVRGESWKHVV